MLPYAQRLKHNSRELRKHMTDAEQKLWYRLRRKQINGWQFYRQKPLGSYIVDFYCPAARLVVEIDGSQHFEPPQQAADQQRDTYLAGLGLRVLRFDNRQVLLEMDAVVDVIAKIPPGPPFSKGGADTHEAPAFEQKTTAPVAPAEKKATRSTPASENRTTSQTPTFENGATTPMFSFKKGSPELPPCKNRTTAPIPPFEKGGLGGIFISPPPEDEMDT